MATNPFQLTREKMFQNLVDSVVNKHFAPNIAKNFYGVLEVEKYNKKNKNILRQIHDQRYVMEVYYTTKEGFHIYICDVFSEWSKQQIELHLLRYISDKVVKGVIGKDWTDINGRISQEVRSGKHLTRDDVV